MGSLVDNFYENGEPLSGVDTIKRIQQETDTVLVAFSYGKDSLANFLAVKPHFKVIVPFFRAMIPGLEFVERRLAYYEDKLGISILRLNSPSFYRVISECLYQPPHRVSYIEALGLPNVEYSQINQIVREAYNLPDHAFVAMGIRAVDSLQRRTTCKSRGPINWSEKTFWPVWDYSHEQVAGMIKAAGLKLPIDYKIWGTSFDGVRHFFLKEVRDRYPEDYQRILEWLPLVDAEFYRRELVGGTYETEEQ